MVKAHDDCTKSLACNNCMKVSVLVCQCPSWALNIKINGISWHGNLNMCFKSVYCIHGVLCWDKKSSYVFLFNRYICI